MENNISLKSDPLGLPRLSGRVWPEFAVEPLCRDAFAAMVFENQGQTT
jgi:hypothetical protein